MASKNISELAFEIEVRSGSYISPCSVIETEIKKFLNEIYCCYYSLEVISQSLVYV